MQSVELTPVQPKLVTGSIDFSLGKRLCALHKQRDGLVLLQRQKECFVLIQLDKAALMPRLRRVQDVHNVFLLGGHMSRLQLLKSHLAHQSLS